MIQGGSTDVPIWPELCGHEVPNSNAGNLNLDPQGKYDEWAGSSVMEMEVDLSHNYRVQDVNGRPGTVFKAEFRDTQGQKKMGRWTSAYDEGFEVRVPHPTNPNYERSYFSFAQYECKNPSGSKCDAKGQGEDATGSTPYHVSNCGHTNVGWFSDVSLLEGHVVGAGCWVGRRTQAPSGRHHSSPTSFLVQDTRSNPYHIPGTVRKQVGRHGSPDKKVYTVFPAEVRCCNNFSWIMFLTTFQFAMIIPFRNFIRIFQGFCK